MRIFLIHVLLVMLSAPALGQLGLEERFVHPVNFGQDQITMDADQDGDMDIVQSTPHGLFIHYQVSPGTFKIETNFPLLALSTFLDAKDVDGDGLKDIVYERIVTGEVLWLRSNGNGNFDQEEVLVSGLFGIGAFQMEDINGDQILDLIYTQSPNKVKWKAGLGGATFGSSTIITDIVYVGARPSQPFFGLADMNGDNDLDLVISSPSNDVTYFENDGFGNFLPYHTANDVFFRRLADMDSDGDIDILVSNSNLEVLWMESLGGGIFTLPDSLIWVMDLISLDAGDLDGDGDTDLMVHTVGDNSAPDRIRIYQNNGSMVFSALPDLWQSDSFYEQKMVFLDNDSFPDILGYASSSFRAYLDDGSKFRISSVITPTRLTMGDVDGDAYPEVFVGAPDAGSSGLEGEFPLGIAMHKNDAGQIAQAGIEIQIANLNFWNWTYRQMFGEKLLDLDGDGDLDLLYRSSLVTNPLAQFYIIWKENNGSGQFIHRDTLANVNAVGGNSVDPDPYIEDLDNDGDLDIYFTGLSGIGVIENNSNGTFGLQYFPSNIWYNRIGSVDVDVDGDKDILIRIYGNDTLFWHENLGSAQFAPYQPILIGLENDSDSRLEAFDLNLDGKEDLLSSSVTAFQPALNTGGAFDTLATTTIPWGARTWADDIDGDGWPDVLASDGAGNILFYKNMQDSTFASAITIGNYIPFGSSGPGDLKTADLDLDGDRDILYAHRNGSAGWFKSYFPSIYRIMGEIFFDENGNGVRDLGDEGLQWLPMQTSPYLSVPYSDTSGLYTFYLDSGNYVVQPSPWDTIWTLTTDSASYQVGLTGNDPISTDNDFGFTPAIDTTMASAALVSTGIGCFGASVMVFSVNNMGTTEPNGSIMLVLDTLLEYSFASIAPDLIQNDTLYWSFEELGYYDQFSVHLYVTGPGVDYLDSLIHSTLLVDILDDQDNLLFELTDSTTVVVACSYDPNDKQVDPAGSGMNGATDIEVEWLNYTIRFQNTGSAPATNVMLTDQLSEHFDWSSMQVLLSSHVLSSTNIEPDGEVVFRFNDILLPDSASDPLASQGFVKFRIALNDGLLVGTEIWNTASIHFDFNPPIITNTTLNTLIDCDLFEANITNNWSALVASEGVAYQWFLNGNLLPLETDQVIFIGQTGEYTVEVTDENGCIALSDPLFVLSVGIGSEDVVQATAIPNPFTDRTTILFSKDLSNASIELMDMNGRIVRNITGHSGDRFILEREELNSGIYFVRIRESNGEQQMLRLLVL